MDGAQKQLCRLGTSGCKPGSFTRCCCVDLEFSHHALDVCLHDLQDLLARFHGSWDLRPKRDAAGNIVGCHAVLKQDVLPKGKSCAICAVCWGVQSHVDTEG